MNIVAFGENGRWKLTGQEEPGRGWRAASEQAKAERDTPVDMQGKGAHLRRRPLQRQTNPPIRRFIPHAPRDGEALAFPGMVQAAGWKPALLEKSDIMGGLRL